MKKIYLRPEIVMVKCEQHTLIAASIEINATSDAVDAGEAATKESFSNYSIWEDDWSEKW